MSEPKPTKRCNIGAEIKFDAYCGLVADGKFRQPERRSHEVYEDFAAWSKELEDANKLRQQYKDEEVFETHTTPGKRGGGVRLGPED